MTRSPEHDTVTSLLGTGRSADVYALPAPHEEWVLRRHRDGGDAEREARVMRDLADHGFPVPHLAAATAFRAADPHLTAEERAGVEAAADLVATVG
ncbi:phosphotransferase enzyme family protein [Streptomyces laurentii]|uniref:Phosphotransferase enzyme family protein n=1 Tax=Streptomyces laurentii TaxID=39478 RepID=A0A160P098_STRLU|nr:phosphotransferase enzyme family protein [Streptomyces laurentii]